MVLTKDELLRIKHALYCVFNEYCDADDLELANKIENYLIDQDINAGSNTSIDVID